MNPLCRRYLSEAKSFFPIMGKKERKFLTTLANTIEDYCETEKTSSLDDIYNAFGKPQSIITSYLDTVDTTSLVKKIQLSKWIKRGVLIFLVLALISVSIFGITTYNTYEALKQQQIFFEEETLE